MFTLGWVCTEKYVPVIYFQVLNTSVFFMITSTKGPSEADSGVEGVPRTRRVPSAAVQGHHRRRAPPH